jgi:ketosteroid isomerase-like protein
VVAALLAAAGCGDAPPTNTIQKDADRRVAALEGDTTAVERTINALNAAFDQKDAEAIATLFTETADVYLFNGTAMTASEFTTALPGIWAGWSDLRTEYSLKGMKLARPYGWAKYEETFTATAAGQPFTMRSLVTLTFEQRGDTWRIGHMHISSGEPPPGHAAPGS